MKKTDTIMTDKGQMNITLNTPKDVLYALIYSHNLLKIMIFKQIHTLPTNPSCGKIALISLAAIGTVIVVCQIAKSE